MTNATYQFELIKPLCVGVHQTTIRSDCDAAEEFLRGIGRYDPKSGDRIMVKTGTCELTFILNNELSQQELTRLANKLNQEVTSAMYREEDTPRGRMNFYLPV